MRILRGVFTAAVLAMAPASVGAQQTVTKQAAISGFVPSQVTIDRIALTKNILVRIWNDRRQEVFNKQVPCSNITLPSRARVIAEVKQQINIEFEKRRLNVVIRAPIETHVDDAISICTNILAERGP